MDINYKKKYLKYKKKYLALKLLYNINDFKGGMRGKRLSKRLREIYNSLMHRVQRHEPDSNIINPLFKIIVDPRFPEKVLENDNTIHSQKTRRNTIAPEGVVLIPNVDTPLTLANMFYDDDNYDVLIRHIQSLQSNIGAIQYNFVEDLDTIYFILESDNNQRQIIYSTNNLKVFWLICDHLFTTTRGTVIHFKIRLKIIFPFICYIIEYDKNDNDQVSDEVFEELYEQDIITKELNNIEEYIKEIAENFMTIYNNNSLHKIMSNIKEVTNLNEYYTCNNDVTLTPKLHTSDNSKLQSYFNTKPKNGTFNQVVPLTHEQNNEENEQVLDRILKRTRKHIKKTQVLPTTNEFFSDYK